MAQVGVIVERRNGSWNAVIRLMKHPRRQYYSCSKSMATTWNVQGADLINMLNEVVTRCVGHKAT